jgi:hypothetical protein
MSALFRQLVSNYLLGGSVAIGSVRVRTESIYP